MNESYLERMRRKAYVFRKVVRGIVREGNPTLQVEVSICTSLGGYITNAYDRYRDDEVSYFWFRYSYPRGQSETERSNEGGEKVKKRDTKRIPIPPTALVTDTAAVNTPSAMVRLVPNRACIIEPVITRFRQNPPTFSSISQGLPI